MNKYNVEIKVTKTYIVPITASNEFNALVNIEESIDEDGIEYFRHFEHSEETTVIV